MNNSPSGDKKSTEKKVNYRIPKVSNLEKRLRHAVSNSTTALTVDLTRHLLEEIGIWYTEPVVIYEDNQPVLIDWNMGDI